MRNRWICGVAVCALLVSTAFVEPASAQDTSISPTAAERRDVTSLPYPDPQFHGQIGRTTADSKADFPQPVAAPKGAPNILLILTDDVGFGASSTFGGPIPTPTLDVARIPRREIQSVQYDGALLAFPRRAHHRA